MITCYVRYVVDASKLDEFETYGKMWIPLVKKFGGDHHGYFLPAEGANNIALALFSFPSLAAYETYRSRSKDDPACIAAFRYAEETRCVISYERSFFRPVLG
ncbi:NIPSNAP family protein [Burkholderia multivorans]|nr:NIPSNAP family protein [Burkholderia multivorans]